MLMRQGEISAYQASDVATEFDSVAIAHGLAELAMSLANSSVFRRFRDRNRNRVRFLSSVDFEEATGSDFPCAFDPSSVEL
jgi:hypothetical protein